MRILLLTDAFNSLAQRLFVELRDDGHDLSVELDIADAVTEEAVRLWQPDVVIAPFLKRRIPESVWSTRLCLVVHPGPPGDRGPAALDWAIEEGAREWGVTLLQATGDFDAGPVWAWRRFAMREDATKSSLYRREVVDAALGAVREALARCLAGGRGEPAPTGQLRGAMTQSERAIDWQRDDNAKIRRRIRAADGHPGLASELFGSATRVFDVHAASDEDLRRAPPGSAGDVVARRGPAVLRRTRDGGLWIGHVRREAAANAPTVKQAATAAFAAETAALPELAVALDRDCASWDELHYREAGTADVLVGFLSFEFHNGAMSTRQCRRMEAALYEAGTRPTRVLVLEGGAEFFANGIHLHQIEAVQLQGGSAADASMDNIEAMDDVALAILSLNDRLVVSALRGNAGAGGCFLALAADLVWAHAGVVQNPHYKNMGNLYGSEYWTYLLPRRVGARQTAELMRARLPLGANEAKRLGLVDALLADDAAAFEPALAEAALALAADPKWLEHVAAKTRRREVDERAQPLAAYRGEELRRMRLNFYGFDASYHVARHHFVHRKPHAWTPRHLALHR